MTLTCKGLALNLMLFLEHQSALVPLLTHLYVAPVPILVHMLSPGPGLYPARGLDTDTVRMNIRTRVYSVYIVVSI